MNIYVGNLPYNVQDAELRGAFEPYGTVTSVEVIFDRRTQRSRGYGFVEMENENEANEAIGALNGSEFQGRELRVDESKPKDEKPSSRPRNPQSTRPNNRANSEPVAAAATGGNGIVGFIKRIFS
ncbi:MAG: RNA recognition motif-containing protein [Gammaproteobacteria bacterium]|jgi:RNA recognition motif-containing protein